MTPQWVVNRLPEPPSLAAAGLWERWESRKDQARVSATGRAAISTDSTATPGPAEAALGAARCVHTPRLRPTGVSQEHRGVPHEHHIRQREVLLQLGHLVRDGLGIPRVSRIHAYGHRATLSVGEKPVHDDRQVPLAGAIVAKGGQPSVPLPVLGWSLSPQNAIARRSEAKPR